MEISSVLDAHKPNNNKHVKNRMEADRVEGPPQKLRDTPKLV